jgi:response regulator RpfG family c-di-GMP phosphodiesterase
MMHILIAEKDSTGRRMLSRILKMEGYEVSVAESGDHAMNLLSEARPDIVLMNVFQCMYSSGAAPTGKISVRHYDEESKPVLLGACNRGGENLAEFMSPNNQYCDAAFDLMPAKVKGDIMDKIQQMCGALRQSRCLPLPEGGFNWQRFNKLMDRSPTLEM